MTIKPKEKFTTGLEVYNRIQWDERLNPVAFVIGFADRMAKTGLREVRFLAWDDGGDVPFHRVRYFRCGPTVVWHRQERVDLFAHDHLPPDAWRTTG